MTRRLPVLSWFVPSMAVVLLLPSLCAAKTAPQKRPIKVAKLPADSAAASRAKKVASSAKRTSKAPPATKPIKVAQLMPDDITAISTSDLILLARDYACYREYATQKAYLQAAASRPASKDTALAQVLLASRLAAEGDATGAQTLFAQAPVTSADEEVQAYAALSQAVAQADPVTQAALLKDYMQQHQGTLTGAWAAMGLAYFDSPIQVDIDAEAVAQALTPVAEGGTDATAQEAALCLSIVAPWRGLDPKQCMEAAQHAVDVCTIDMYYRRAFCGIAYALERLGDNAGAMERFTQVIEAWPDQPVVMWGHEGRFQLALTARDWPMARAEAKVCVNYPQLGLGTIADSHYVLAITAFWEADFITARSEYQSMAATQATEHMAVAGEQGAASCLMAKGDYAAATAEYEALALQHPTFPEYCAEARYQIGDMLYRQRRYTEALVHFQRVLSEFAATSWVTVAKERIAEIEGVLALRQSEAEAAK